jgi:hypothetical protein
MDYLRVKNWEQFQHYKDRSPPWIKLHRTLIDDYEFCCLPDETKAHLVLIWLLASQNGGRIPAEPGFLASKIGARKPPNLKLLTDQGFLIREQDASKALASGEQGASDVLALARSREERREEERRVEENASVPLAAPTDEHRSLATSLGLNADAEWERFGDYCKAKGRKYRDSAAAFRNWLRQERKWAERDGRVPVANQPRRLAL